MAIIFMGTFLWFWRTLYSQCHPIACIHTHPHNGEAVCGLVQWRTNPHQQPLAVTQWWKRNHPKLDLTTFCGYIYAIPRHYSEIYGVVALANKAKNDSFVLSRKHPMDHTL